MEAVIEALVWIAGAGAIGGALNALATDNLHPWPSHVARAAGRGLFRPGLAVNIAVGAALSAGTHWTFAGGAGARWLTTGGALLGIVAGLVIGALGARSITDEADKRFLRAAACKAAAAPAADPATIREMELAPPYAVLKIATALEPRRATLR